ncbi:MAG: insulinase family protein [Candidatus Krumholzibacteria bacterium]|nr:insulinase family protein [Candidatus Krumholzibacteria bacterium]
MKRRILFTVLAVVLVAALASPLLAGKRKHPSKLKYPPIEITSPEVIGIALGNGMEGFLIEDHEVPVVDIVILFPTYFPEEGKYGLNEMAQWVIRNGGSESWPSDKLNEELEFLAAGVEVYGGNLNTSVAINCLKKDLDAVLAIAADLIINPVFPEDKIEKKRGDMLEEIRRKNDQPRAIARREFYKLVYKGHPYGWDTNVGSIEAITREDLTSFHAAYFNPNRAILGISGDVTVNEIIGKLENALEGWEQAETVIPAVPAVEPVLAENWNYAYKDISQAYMMLGHFGINSKNEDRCALQVMNFILGGGSFTSWIVTEVREKKGLAYSTGSRFGSDAFTLGAFYAFAQTKGEEYSRAMKIMVEQIERMRDVGPTEEELRKAIDSYVNGQVFDYDSKSGMVRRLVRLKFEGRPLDTPEKDMERYANMTLEDVKTVAGKYLHPDKMTIFVVGDKATFDKPLSDFGEVNVIDIEE